MQSQRQSQGHPLGMQPPEGMLLAPPPNTSPVSSGGDATGSHLDYTAILHNIPMHLLVLCVILFLLHLGCMLHRHAQKWKAGSEACSCRVTSPTPTHVHMGMLTNT